MKFTLTYTGKLKANGGPAHKHEIRRKIHPQLKVLWSHPPLDEWQECYLPHDPGPNEDTNLNRKRPPFTFVPLVTPSLQLVCDLDILLLRPGPPGGIITQGGDIDNRLKTRLDALRIPTKGELPRGTSPSADETPFFCLLEDDSLIVGLRVDTDMYLKSDASSSDVHMVLRVTTRETAFILSSPT